MARSKEDPKVKAAREQGAALAKAMRKEATAQHTQRADAWSNVYSGMGYVGKDRSMSTTFQPREPLSFDQTINLYRQNSLAKRLVDDICHDATRAGFELQVTDDPDTSPGGTPAKMYAAWERLRLLDHMQEGLRWGLVTGGAAALMYTDDKLPEGAIQSVAQDQQDASFMTIPLPKGANLQQLVVTDRRYAVPLLSRYTIDPTSPNFGNPEEILITPYGYSHQTIPKTVNWSRALRFDGVPTDVLTRVANLTWGDSIYESAWDALSRYGAAYQGAATLVSEYSLKVLKMKGLADLMSSEQWGAVLGRVLGLRMGWDMNGTGIIDADAEELTRLTASITGLRDVLDAFRDEVIAATRLLKSRVYGGQQGALASGQADAELWAQYVHGWQQRAIVPNLHRVTQLIFESSDWAKSGGQVPKQWAIKCNPIDPPDLDAEVDRRFKQAQLDKIYIDSYVLEASEVRKSRMGGAAYSHETTIDPQLTEELAEAERKARVEPALPAGTEPETTEPPPEV